MLIFTPCQRTAVLLERIVMLPEDPGLAEHVSHQLGLAVIHVGDDGEGPEIW